MIKTIIQYVHVTVWGQYTTTKPSEWFVIITIIWYPKDTCVVLASVPCEYDITWGLRQTYLFGFTNEYNNTVNR